MSKLAFSEYYLISSACLKMPPDFEIKLFNDSTGFHRQDLGGTRPGGFCRKFWTGRLRPEVAPLSLLYTHTFLGEVVPLLYTFHGQMVPLSHT